MLPFIHKSNILYREVIMDIKTLRKILNEKTMQFTEAEIQNMIDEELEKPPEEMDTKFIDFCMDVLENNKSK